MKSIHLPAVLAASAAALGLLIVSGCSTTRPNPAERHANDAVDVQTLSPRDYLRAVDPWERREIERDADAAYYARAKRAREQCR